MKSRLLAPFLAFWCALSAGCVYTSVTTKEGVKLTRISFGADARIGEVDLQKGTLRGYQSEQAQAAAAIAEGVARGLVK